MSQWFFVNPRSSERVGPLDPDAAFAYARQNADHVCWREGLSGWQPVRAMPEFAEAVGAPGTHAPPPPPPIGGRGMNDDIDYRIVGNDMPFSFKVFGQYLLPGGIAFSGTLQHFKGFPELTTVLVTARVELVDYGQLPRTERKSQRVFDTRIKDKDEIV